MRPYFDLMAKSCGVETPDRTRDILIVEDFYTQMVDPLLCSRTLDQYEFERWLIKCEVGITGPPFVNFGPKHLGIKVYCLFEIVHIQC